MHTKIRYIFTFLLLWSSSFVWAQVPGFYMKEEKRKVTLPFHSNNNLIIVPVSVNGGAELNFLIDTGVKSNILFSKAIGDEMGLFYTRTLNLMGADGKTVLTAMVSPNNHFDLGPLEGTAQAILVLTEDFLELEQVVGLPIHGIIGYEFFKYNPVKIDYDHNIISFYRSDALKWRPFGYRKIDLLFDNYKPYVMSEIRQVAGPHLEAKLLIDSGANHGLLLNRETSEHIQLPPRVIETDLGRSLGGDLFGFVGRVRRYSLKRLHFRRVITSFPNETEFSSIILQSGRLGSIGSDILSRMQVIFDYPRERMLFKKGSNFTTPFEYDMSGMKIRMTSAEERRYYVSQVLENTPAHEEGIQVGDEVLEINLLSAQYWEVSEIANLLKSEDGKSIIFTLRRNVDGNWQTFTVTITLEKQL